MVDRLISLVISLHQTPFLEPKLILQDRVFIETMVGKLLHYLHKDFSVYHVRAVSLLWSLQASTPGSQVESTIAQSMSSSDINKVMDAYEAFGTIWRFSGV